MLSAHISNQTRKAVYRRDGYRCALCDDTRGLQVHHVVRRSQGGLGTEENIWTGCQRCHNAFDSEATDGPLHARMRDYFKTLYPQWDESKQKYRKWEA